MWEIALWIAVLCGCTLVAMMLLRGGGSAQPLQKGYVSLVVGLRGHGKSLFVARLIAERLAAGVPVVANFTVVDSPVERMRSWEDAIMAPRGSMVVLDEASGWAGARSGTSLRPAVSFYVSQARKLGHEVWLIAQHENQIAGAVRDQVNEMVLCSRQMFGWHRATSWAPHEFRKKAARPLWAWWYRPAGPAVDVYNTFDLVPPEVTSKSTHEADMAMILRCIAAIKARDAIVTAGAAGRPVTVAGGADELSAWLSAAGVDDF